MKRMLINSTQPEEVRVALVDGQKLYPLCDNPFRGGDAECGMFVVIFRAARVAAPAATKEQNISRLQLWCAGLKVGRFYDTLWPLVEPPDHTGPVQPFDGNILEGRSITKEMPG